MIAAEKNGKYFQELSPHDYYYVSLGDSIAAAQAATSNERYQFPACWEWQYGTEGVYSTEIIPPSYTQGIYETLTTKYKNPSAKSFARSGIRVNELIQMLDQPAVKRAISKANLVTICIGANDVLIPALTMIESYIQDGGAINEIGNVVQQNINALADNNNAYSYWKLFEKLNNINKDRTDVKYVFTNIYNPLKYLWLEESTENADYKDGFFGPIMWSVDWMGGLGNTVRSALYNTEVVQTLFNRINGPSRNGSDSLATWTEGYINKLNSVIDQKIKDYNNPKFIMADTKELFDSIPDRPYPSLKHYNDLVHIDFTRGVTTDDMDWGNYNWFEGFNIGDVLSGNYGAIMSNVVQKIILQVIIPDIDPHPKEFGQMVLWRSFLRAMGWWSPTEYTITYDANGGSGSLITQTVIGVEIIRPYVTIKNNPFTRGDGYLYTNWNTSATGGGSQYSGGQYVQVNSSMTLYAQWSTITYRLKYMNSKGSECPSGQTGPQEYYELKINDVPQGDLSTIGNVRWYNSLPYGTKVTLTVGTKGNGSKAWIDWNDKSAPGTSGTYKELSYTFYLTPEYLGDSRVVTVEVRWRRTYENWTWLEWFEGDIWPYSK